MEYASVELIESAVSQGVTFTIAKMSFGRRVELMRRIRELAARREFVAAGDTSDEKMEAALLASEIDRTYLLWGLREVNGLELDGLPATPESLISSASEELCREALAAVKQQCGLSEAERKN